MVGKVGMVDLLKANLLQILFPPYCCGCGQPLVDTDDRNWCCSCLARVVYVTSPLCPLCGMGLSSDAGDHDRWCFSCLKHQPPFDKARSLVQYGDPIRTLLHRLKFNADTRVTAGLRSLVKKGGGCFENKEYDLIVPVPLFPARLRKRGLNQALVLARIFFADQSEKIDPTILIKAKNTPAQSGLGGPARRKNLVGSILVKPGTKLEKMRICLVDDIFTTGATAFECSLILKEKGAANVDVVTFARA
ncbi:MAG: ComF family protein [Desulfofustis sp.]|nr:ComF family protein [Desulfofustis sp.]